MNTNPEKETDERIAVLVTNLSLLALRLGGWAGALPLLATPMLFIHIILEQNFYQYLVFTVITLYLMQIRTNKNAHEKEHTFSRKSKNQKQNEQSK